MLKAKTQWRLFTYVEEKLTPLSKPFRTKAEAEKTRLKYRERKGKKMGVGVVRA